MRDISKYFVVETSQIIIEMLIYSSIIIGDILGRKIYWYINRSNQHSGQYCPLQHKQLYNFEFKDITSMLPVSFVRLEREGSSGLPPPPPEIKQHLNKLKDQRKRSG